MHIKTEFHLYQWIQNLCLQVVKEGMTEINFRSEGILLYIS